MQLNEYKNKSSCLRPEQNRKFHIFLYIYINKNLIYEIYNIKICNIFTVFFLFLLYILNFY